MVRGCDCRRSKPSAACVEVGAVVTPAHGMTGWSYLDLATWVSPTGVQPLPAALSRKPWIVFPSAS